MQVKEIMSKNPLYIAPTTTVKEASQKMCALNCGFIPIGDNDRLVGAVTDRDITTRATAIGKDPNKTQVKEVMTESIVYCYEDDDLTTAAKSMMDKQVHRLAVLNKDKRFTGILSFSDIATKLHDTQLCGKLAESLHRSGTTH